MKTFLRPSTRLWLLKLVLRIGGVATAAAFLAVFLPVEWMARTHEAVGLGPFPRAPVVDYLARSIAALYGFHGVLLLTVARDPIALRPIVSYVAFVNVCFGAILLGIDLHSGMPMWWTLGEGPPIAALGVALAWLNSSIPTAAGQSAHA
jgi:hypothetical protein